MPEDSGKRGYKGVEPRDSRDSREENSVYDDAEDGGMLQTSRDAATRAQSYEQGGKQQHPARYICGSVVCTLVVVVLAIVVGSGTDSGRDAIIRYALGSGSDWSGFHAQFVDPNFEGSPKAENIRDNLRDLTTKPHIAGSMNDLETAEYVKRRMNEYGWDADIVKYDVLLMYPKVEDDVPYAELEGSCERGRSCAGMTGAGGVFTASLEERVYQEDGLSDAPAEGNPAPWGTSQLPFPTFNGYSPSTPAAGVTGPVVYANYGRREDFELLAKMGVEVQGAIVIARYGRLFRGSKADNAHNAGAQALLIYSDPADYAKLGTEPENVYPNTRFLPGTGVQRGTIFTGSGDPLTPGVPSTSDALRLDPEDRDEYITSETCPNAGGCTSWGTERLLPAIPTHPISYEDAAPFLLNLEGQSVPTANSQRREPVQHTTGDWRGAVPGVTYKFGETTGNDVVTAHLTLRSNITTAPIWNVVTVIPGELDPEHVVVLGNHRDAWVAGAIDPTSGTAAVLETGRALAVLRDQGWKPRRTIVWCSWDAEEYGLLGSTEWAEQHDNLLRARAVTYINLDSAVSGASSGFSADATPNFDHVIRDVAKTVYDPEGEYESLYAAWQAKSEERGSTQPEPQVGRLGSGSDYTPFLQHLGIPSVSLAYSGEYPVYHSQYDSFDWTRRFADEITPNCPTGFCRHAAMATYVGAFTLRIADDRILPMNYTHYAIVMQGYTENIRDSPSRRGGIADAPNMKCPCSEPATNFGTCPVDTSADAIDGMPACPIGKCRFLSSSRCPRSQVSMQSIFNALDAMLVVTATVELDRQRLSLPGNTEIAAARDLNDRLVLAERALTTREGLRDRPWFKHLVYAPGFFNNCECYEHPGTSNPHHNLISRDVSERLRVLVFSDGTDNFPAITDALCHTLVDEECVPDWRHVRVEIARTAEAIREAVDALRPSSVSFRSTD